MSFRLAALLLSGALVAEGIGYLWHRLACHVGIFRHLSKDLLRRRHFDHHMNKYAGAGLRHDTYSPSCDIAFRVLGIISVGLIITFTAVGWIQPSTAITILSGTLVQGFLGTKLHALYHVSDRSARRLPILGWGPVWRVFSWLRDFHDVHHLVNANYSLMLPLFDLVGGTYISPRKLPRLQEENLFPRFDPHLSSSCETPLF